MLGMSRDIIAGIDIGTHSVKVIIAQLKDKSSPIILGTGFKHTHGLKNGYVTNSREVTRSLQVAIAKAEKMANYEIDSAYLAIGGIGLDSVYTKVDLSITRAESAITQNDIDKLIEKARAKLQKKLINRKILHDIVVRYKVDGEDVLGTPVGLRGNKLSADVMLITTLEPHYKALNNIVESLDIEVLDTLASPVAASLVVLSKEQKEAGCVLANIGAETLSIIVYEDGTPISLKVFPTGSSDITNEIALKLQVPLAKAEEMKRGALFDQNVPQKKLNEIIDTRLKEMFTLIKAHLKEIGKDGLLPAGVILTGGGVGLSHITDLAKNSLKLPSELAQLKLAGKSLRDSTWSVALGLCVYGLGQRQYKNKFGGFKIFRNVRDLLKHFMP